LDESALPLAQSLRWDSCW